jgi:DNA mismatch repair protein MutS2
MHALRVLEFHKIIVKLVDQCETELGRHQAHHLKPIFQSDQVWAQLALTKEASDFLERATVPTLAPVKDLRQPVNESGKGKTLSGEQLIRLANALKAMREQNAAVHRYKEQVPKLWSIARELPSLGRLEEKLFKCIDSGGEVLDAASSELAKIRQRKKQAAQKVVSQIQSYTIGSVRELLSDPIYTIRDGRYVIPLKAENRGKIKGIVHGTSASGQTLYLEPDTVLELTGKLTEIEIAEKAEIIRILTNLSKEVGLDAKSIVVGIEYVADLDVLYAKARLGASMNATIPLQSKESTIEIKVGRHPLLDPVKAVPLTLGIGHDFDVLLLTGPNTGGKTVSIKTVGLFVLMIQSGMMVPAAEVRAGCFSQVWADIGDEQSLEQSLSTFSGHIKNISCAFQKLKSGALVLLDEIGAGTDPAEGAALAKAVLFTLQQQGAKVVSSSHYGELKLFSHETPRFKNAAMEFDLKNLSPTYHLLMGETGTSYALKIAEKCGISKDIVELASSYQSTEHTELSKILEKLQLAQKQARVAQSKADSLAARLKIAEEKAHEKFEEAKEAKRVAKVEVKKDVQTVLRELRLEAEGVFKELRSGAGAKESQSARKKLKTIQERGAVLGSTLAPELEPMPSSGPIQKGSCVLVKEYGQKGTVLEFLKEGLAVVQIGALKVHVPLNELVHVEDVKEISKRPYHHLRKLISTKQENISSELNIRQMRAEDALEKLEKFIDSAVTHDLPSVRIVHGKGTGVLRHMTQTFLRRHPAVKNVQNGSEFEGGDGVTVAYFK